MTPAPIILFAYKRLAHIRNTVNSLLSNPEARDSTLYLFSDGPRSPAEQNTVEEVRNYVRSITGFAKVTPIFRDSNWGLSRSIISGVSETLKTHDRAIIVEDDLVVSPCFLSFMNTALEKYEREEIVASICGYFYPIKKILPETFFLRTADCWGWATWRRGWTFFNSDGKSLLAQIESQGLVKKFDIQGSYPYTQMLRDQIDGKNNSWAIRWQASLFLGKRLTLYPGRSLVQNTGFDNSGEHCGATNVFDGGSTQDAVTVGTVPITENSAVESLMAEYFRKIETPPRASVRNLVGRFFRKVAGV